MGKDPGPLARCQKDCDLVKKKVEKAVKDSLKLLSNKKLKTNEEHLQANYKICYELQAEVVKLQQTVDELEEENEPSKVRNFSGKKQAEVKRLTTWETQLKGSMSKLLPEDKEKEYIKQLKKDAGEVSEEEVTEEQEQTQTEDKEEESEDDVTEDEDENDEDETTEKTLDQTGNAIKHEDDDDDDEESEEEEDESYEEEEVEEEEDKIPEAKAKDKTVPSEEEEEEETEEEGEEEETEEESGEEEEESVEEEESGEEETETEDEKEKDDTEVAPTLNQFVALDDYQGEEGDLNFKKGEILTILNTSPSERADGWWEAENEQGEKGIVPSTYLQMYNKYADVQQSEDETEEELEEGTGKSKSGKMRWAGIRKALNEGYETGVTDVLHAMGAVPSGFRPSTLAYKLHTEETYKMKNYLVPKLSTSNLFYKDLFYDPATSKIRPRTSGLERVVTILSCRQIPLPGAGLKVMARYVRVCLFDGQNILSNIHTIKVGGVDKEQRTWMFNTRISDLMDTFMHAEFFVRTDSLADNIGILFELGVSYTRKSTEEEGEFSCGWVHLPLREADGTIINKTVELQVNGGTPYEKGVEVDPAISRRATGNAFMSLLSGNKQPRLNIRVSIPKKDQKDQIDLLPSTLVGNMVLLPFYRYYREILADVLLRDRLDLDSTELVHHPTLAAFPEGADQHDLMKILRDAWLQKIRNLKKSEMRDREFMKKAFCEVVNTTVYPLLHKQNMLPYKDGSYKVETDRFESINSFWKYRTEKRTTLAVLLSSEIEFTPFEMSEVAFNVIGPHCLPKPTHVH